MHLSSIQAMQHVFNAFVLPRLQDDALITVLDIGGLDVNGSYRQIFSHPNVRYIAADLGPGPGVDVVLRDAYSLPFTDRSIDMVVSGQTFEHCPRFWDMAREMGRVLKPGGQLALICPSEGPIHRYPVDCYRFLPDSMEVIAEVAGLDLMYVEHGAVAPWRDLVGVMEKPAATETDRQAGVPDETYLDVLEFLHRVWQPRTYLEIGTDAGASLALARCASIAVDPMATAKYDVLFAKPMLKYFAQTSDAFFADVDARAELGGRPVDFAFIDGFHSFDQVLRDLLNLEPFCTASSVVCLHDVLPRTPAEASRERRSPSWAGDVWKIAPILQACRPDLRVACLDVAPTGLLLITGFAGNAPKIDIDAVTARFLPDPVPSLETLKEHMKALTPDAFFAGPATTVLPQAWQGTRTADLLPLEPATFQKTLHRIRHEVRAADERQLLEGQVASYPLFPMTWRRLLRHLINVGEPQALVALAERHPAAFCDPEAGAELNLVVADAALAAGNPAAEETALTKALDSNPSSLPALRRLAGRRLTAGQPQEAEELLRRALDLAPDHEGTALGLSTTLLRQNRPADAAALLRDRLSRHSASAKLHHHLATVLARLQDWTAAVEHFEKSLALDPGNAAAQMQLSGALGQLGRREDAIAAARMATLLDPANAGFAAHLARLTG